MAKFPSLGVWPGCVCMCAVTVHAYASLQKTPKNKTDKIYGCIVCLHVCACVCGILKQHTGVSCWDYQHSITAPHLLSSHQSLRLINSILHCWLILPPTPLRQRQSVCVRVCVRNCVLISSVFHFKDWWFWLCQSCEMLRHLRDG